MKQFSQQGNSRVGEFNCTVNNMPLGISFVHGLTVSTLRTTHLQLNRRMNHVKSGYE